MKFDYGWFVRQASVVFPNYDATVEQQIGLKSGSVVNGEIWELYGGVLYIRYQNLALPIDMKKTEAAGKVTWYVKSDENGWLSLQCLPYYQEEIKPISQSPVSKQQFKQKKYWRTNNKRYNKKTTARRP